MKQWFNKLLFGSAGGSTPSGDRSELAELQALFEAADYDRADVLCRKLLEDEPGDHIALIWLADIAMRRKTAAEVISLIRRGIAEGATSAEVHYKLGCLLEDTAEYPAAIEAYQTAVRIAPDFAKAHNNLGGLYQMLGRMDDALSSFRQAFELDPGLWNAAYNLGIQYKLRGRFEESMAPFQQAMQIRRAPDAPSEVDTDEFRISHSKLIHDIEQLRYLKQAGIESDAADRAGAVLEHVLRSIPARAANEVCAVPVSLKPSMKPVFNRLLNFYNAPALAGGALNPDLDWRRIEAEYFANGPGMTYVDQFLRPEALASLRRFCMESTIWFDYQYHGGYVGCSFEDGFICPLLAQIAEEQRLAAPAIFGDHRITGLWGYKYDSKQTGISVHADFAAVNVNFWLAPDAANLQPGKGGLVVWDKEAPLDWPFEEFNNNTRRINQFLESSGARPWVVPHRQNRVVLFNSDLFHRTDDYHFQDGYENRRINITMLYGVRADDRSA
jgi:tetratricopeptide (TPR) repeat protein